MKTIEYTSSFLALIKIKIESIKGFIQDFFMGGGKNLGRREPHVCLTTPTFLKPHPFDCKLSRV